MWELTAVAALVLGIIALVRLAKNWATIKDQQYRLYDIEQKLSRMEGSAKTAPEEAPEAPGDEALVAEELLERHASLVSPPPPKASGEPVDEQIEPAAASDAAADEPTTILDDPETPDFTAPESDHPTIPDFSLQPKRPLARPPARAPLPGISREDWAQIEEKLGKEWITWVGAVVLFLAGGLFVKYAFDHKWLGPSARVMLGVVCGIGLGVAGERFIRRRFIALGQGLIGAGLAILYASLYAAYGLYDLLPQSVTFGFMAMVTIAGVSLAVVHDAIAVSFIAVLGGLVTPLLLRTGKDPRDALFCYLLLLDVGVLVVAFFKQWRALDVLAFFGTAALFAGWHYEFGGAATYSILPTMLWLGAFYVVFGIQPFVYHLRLASPIPGERFFMAVSNCVWTFGWAYAILHPAHKHILGLVTIAMSADYLALGVFARKRIESDKRAVFGFVALSVALITIAVPIHFDLHGVTIAWAVQGSLLLYLAYKYDYFPVRVGSLIPLSLAAIRIFVIHWPLHDGPFAPIFNANFGTALLVVVAGAAYTAIQHYYREDALPTDRTLKTMTAMVSAFLALTVLHFKIWLWLDFSELDVYLRVATAFMWVGGAATFLAAGVKLRCEHSRNCGIVALAMAAGLCAWDYGTDIGVDYVLCYNLRFIAALTVVLMVFAHAYVLRRIAELTAESEQSGAKMLYGFAIAMLFILLNVEIYLYLSNIITDPQRSQYVIQMSLSIIWGVYAAVMLAIGFGRKVRTIRLCALALFGLTALKLVIIDMARIEEVYRIVSFFVLGILMIAVSYVYHRVEKTLSET